MLEDSESWFSPVSQKECGPSGKLQSLRLRQKLGSVGRGAVNVGAQLRSGRRDG